MKGAAVAVLPANFNDADYQGGHGNDDNFDTAPTKSLLLSSKPRWSRPAKSGIAFFIFIALGALTLTTEMEVLPRWANFDPRCSPAKLDVTAINYRSDHRFYIMTHDMKTLSPPTFRGSHEALCSDENAEKRKFEYCLPITSQDDPVFCAGADRMDLLVRQSPLTLCRASVINLLLSDVYEELEASGAAPNINVTSPGGNAEDKLAAAARRGVSTITYSGDIKNDELVMALRQKGYHLFLDGSTWSACVAPTHPLASHLYDPDRKMPNSASFVPHVELASSEQNASVGTPNEIQAHAHLGSDCIPNVLNAKHIQYHSSHRFYTMLQTMEILPAPVFHGEHKALCKQYVNDDKVPYCLPISARNDGEFCDGADRIDLLVRQTPSTLCLASVFHLLASDVFDELRVAGGSPIVNLDEGNQDTVIEHINITYSANFVNVDDLKLALLRKGYHLYYGDGWRVCVAPIHPLAANLYNPNLPALEVYTGPYLELVPHNQAEKALEETEAPTEMTLEETESPTEVVLEETETPITSEMDKTPEETEAPSMRVNLPAATVLGRGCEPTTVSIVDDRGEFYSALNSTGPLLPPKFTGQHEVLCNSDDRKHRAYRYCLPISGRKDTPLCAKADRMDILLRQSPAKQCYSSVLHVLLKDVYDELKAIGSSPILTFGTLLGAIRDGSMIPFTEDVDIAYNGKIVDGGELDQRLWRKGYHLFDWHIWRVCVAPTHPLASQLYDPTCPLVEEYAVPYVDLYAMCQQCSNEWSMEELGIRSLPNDKVMPFSQVTINGEQFDTVRDPHFLLVSEYGADYMTPKPRSRRLAWADYR